MRHSKLKEAVARVLKQEGFITDFGVSGGPLKKLEISLKIKNRQGVIAGIKKISKPGLRKYVGAGEMPRVLGGLGVAIISTSQGVMRGASRWPSNPSTSSTWPPTRNFPRTRRGASCSPGTAGSPSTNWPVAALD